MNKVCLGDSVYVAVGARNAVVLTAENGYSDGPRNKIILEAEVIENLLLYLSMRAIRQDTEATG